MLGILEHVAINTPEMERSLAFYRDVLGLTVEDEVWIGGVHRVYLQAGSASVELLAYDHSLEPSVDRQEHAGLRHFALRVDDIRKAHEFLQGQGVEFIVPPTPGAGRVKWKALFHDPLGIEIELIER